MLDPKNLGSGAIDDTYRKFEENAPTNVVTKGDHTGPGGKHPGTIMWQRLSENKPLGWYEDLLG